MSTIKKQAFSGVVWTFVQQFSLQIINFIVQIILARLLMPEMFGLIAMLTVFIAIGQMLMDGGMTSSLIRTKNPTQLDYSTVFVTNFIISFGAYLLTFFASPYIARFYNQEILKDILRVYALTFVVRSFVAVHVAKLTKEMNFKTQMILQIPSTIAGAIVGVLMAYMGYGVWSLVFLNLTQSVVFTVQYWVFIPWRPSFIFNKEKFKYHFNFGYKLTAAALLDTVYKNLYNILIGKVFSPTITGYYNQADTIRLLPVTHMATVLDKVTFPLFSSISDDKQLKNAFKTTMKLAVFISVPIMMYLIVMANEIFIFVLGEKWTPAVPYFQILGVSSIIRPLHSYNLNILKVKNRSDLFLRLEVVKKIIGFVAILVSIPFGIMPLVYSYTISYYIMVLLNTYFSGKQINYRMSEQLKDISVLFVIGIISSLVAFFFNKFLILVPLSVFLRILFVGFAFLTVYIFLVFLFEKEVLLKIKNITK